MRRPAPICGASCARPPGGPPVADEKVGPAATRQPPGRPTRPFRRPRAALPVPSNPCVQHPSGKPGGPRAVSARPLKAGKTVDAQSRSARADVAGRQPTRHPPGVPRDGMTPPSADDDGCAVRRERRTQGTPSETGRHCPRRTSTGGRPARYKRAPPWLTPKCAAVPHEQF